jgi:methionyl-tRNA formyltransferase
MPAADQVLVSVVIPLLNEEGNVKPLYERLKSSLTRFPFKTEIIFADDGSTDSTPELLSEIARADREVRIVTLGRNAGQHAAILEGFRRSSGDFIVTLDGDLQNPPEEIPKLLDRLSEGFDVVAGWRKHRKDSPLRLLVSWILDLFASVATGVRMRDYGCMLRAYRRPVLEMVLRYGRHTPFIPTLVTSMGAKTCEVPIGHAPRERGESKYGLAGLLALYLSLVLDFVHIRMGFRPKGRAGASIVFFGYGLVGHACLDELLRMGQNIQCVVTHEDDPAEARWFPSVCDLAVRNHIPVLRIEQAGEDALYERLKGLKPGLVLSVFYRKILPRRILDIPRLGAVNLHASLLPKYRGRCPLNWAIIKGEKKTGVTLHYMTEKPDTGDMIGQLEFDIDPADDIKTIYEKAVVHSRGLLRKYLPPVAEQKTKGIVQDETKASYFGGRTPADGSIDWAQSPDEILNLIRGVTHPFPGAFSLMKGKKLFIWKAILASGSGDHGSVLSTANGTFVVAAGKGALALMRVQVEGGSEIDGGAALEVLGVRPGDGFET